MPVPAMTAGRSAFASSCAASLDQRGVPLRAALGAVLLRHLDRLFLDAAEEDVGRDLEEHGAVAAGEGDAKRLREIVLDAVGERNGGGPLRDRPHHLDGARISCSAPMSDVRSGAAPPMTSSGLAFW